VNSVVVARCEASLDRMINRTPVRDPAGPRGHLAKMARLREDPGHRWDHWSIAELIDLSAAAARPAVGLGAKCSFL